MTTDKREHEARDEILLPGSSSRTDGEWQGVWPLPAAASCDLAHAHLQPVTLQLDASSCYTTNFDLDMPDRVSTKRKEEGSYSMERERRSKHSHRM